MHELPTWAWIAGIAAGWAAIVAGYRFILVPGLERRLDAPFGLVLTWIGNWILARVVHRVRFVGRGLVPRGPRPGPLIVVSNHTGSIDPTLIQAMCPFVIRWLMARETMVPALDWLWYGFELVIPVDRSGRDVAPLRRALRILKDGGVVGIFPEGRIVHPRGEIWPFIGGVGMLVARSRARVLLTWVSGTPETVDMLPSLLTPSRSRVEVVGVYAFEADETPEAISDFLRAELARASGWPLSDRPRARKAADEGAAEEAGDDQPG